jgi:4-amino-4-deoxy-L-arabinose transferase-like glycosyltransferase
MNIPTSSLPARQWILIALIALAPLWMTGIYGRGYWTPDEPREADISWRMSFQADQSLPQLADEPFMEKPPLSYWMSAASMKLFGVSPAAARTPNLLYVLMSTLAVWWLVNSMTGGMGATLAAVVAGSACISYQVAIWLAPDASLLSGCTIALLGVYRGYVANTGHEKLKWYTLMHLGAMMGFMAKSAVGWIYPALTLFVMMIWERRWSELKYWQLWVGFIPQVLVIGGWIYNLAQLPNGQHALTIMFWNNLAGRFTDINASGEFNYAAAHLNWPGKYWAELPYYLIPWTLLAVAALYRAWTNSRIKTSEGTAWRFGIAASLPFLTLLSFATTARNIYAAPAMLGFAVLIGLWLSCYMKQANTLDVWMLRLTRYGVLGIALLISGLMILLAITANTSFDVLVYVALIVLLWVILFFMFRHGSKAEAQRSPMSVGWLYAMYVATIAMAGLTVFPVFDRVQDLGSIAQAVRRDVGARPLALLDPDETTIAMMDYQLKTPMTLLKAQNKDALAQAKEWFEAHPNDGLLLVKLPGSASGDMAKLASYLKKNKPANNGVLTELEQAGVGRLFKLYELPMGRRYALLDREVNLLSVDSSSY